MCARARVCVCVCVCEHVCVCGGGGGVLDREGKAAGCLPVELQQYSTDGRVSGRLQSLSDRFP